MIALPAAWNAWTRAWPALSLFLQTVSMLISIVLSVLRYVNGAPNNAKPIHMIIVNGVPCHVANAPKNAGRWQRDFNFNNTRTDE